MQSFLRSCSLIGCVLLPTIAGGTEPLSSVVQARQVVVTRGKEPVLRYVFQDDEVRRPYFTALHAPGGREVTRRQPPREGIDPTDHATMHPGAWLAFGELGGADFWRNKGHVQHVEFVAKPAVEASVCRFKVRNEYRSDGRTVCQEQASYTLRIHDNGYLLEWDSTFSGSELFAFGDQEEMGLGIRLATPLCVKGGSGAITTSEGKRNEAEAWGTQAQWCDYSGTIDGQRVGILVIPHDDNFRPSWLHVRDYGLLVANPFGRQALTRGTPSRVEVQAGQTLRLRFGLWWYGLDQDQPLDPGGVRSVYHGL